MNSIIFASVLLIGTAIAYNVPPPPSHSQTHEQTSGCGPAGCPQVNASPNCGPGGCHREHSSNCGPGGCPGQHPTSGCGPGGCPKLPSSGCGPGGCPGKLSSSGCGPGGCTGKLPGSGCGPGGCPGQLPSSSCGPGGCPNQHPNSGCGPGGCPKLPSSGCGPGGCPGKHPNSGCGPGGCPSQHGRPQSGHSSSGLPPSGGQKQDYWWATGSDSPFKECRPGSPECLIKSQPVISEIHKHVRPHSVSVSHTPGCVPGTFGQGCKQSKYPENISCKTGDPNCDVRDDGFGLSVSDPICDPRDPTCITDITDNRDEIIIVDIIQEPDEFLIQNKKPSKKPSHAIIYPNSPKKPSVSQPGSQHVRLFGSSQTFNQPSKPHIVDNSGNYYQDELILVDTPVHTPTNVHDLKEPLPVGQVIRFHQTGSFKLPSHLRDPHPSLGNGLPQNTAYQKLPIPHSDGFPFKHPNIHSHLPKKSHSGRLPTHQGSFVSQPLPSQHSHVSGSSQSSLHHGILQKHPKTGGQISFSHGSKGSLKLTQTGQYHQDSHSKPSSNNHDSSILQTFSLGPSHAGVSVSSSIPTKHKNKFSNVASPHSNTGHIQQKPHSVSHGDFSSGVSYTDSDTSASRFPTGIPQLDAGLFPEIDAGRHPTGIPEVDAGRFPSGVPQLHAGKIPTGLPRVDRINTITLNIPHSLSGSPVPGVPYSQGEIDPFTLVPISTGVSMNGMNMMMMPSGIPSIGGSCSAGLFCIKPNSCNPYNGFIIRNLNQVAAVRFGQETVPLLRCFIPGTQLTDGVCCQEPHPIAGTGLD